MVKKNSPFVLLPLLILILAGCLGGYLLYNRLTQEEVALVEEVTSPEIVHIEKTNEEWEKILTPEQFRVTRLHGTEYPHTNEYNKTMTAGIYNCVCCDLPLFASDHKFISTSGWPSFFQPIDKKNVGFTVDRSWSQQVRTEVHCKRCNGHLGHVFDDGPEPTNLRYCINSASVVLKPSSPNNSKKTDQ